MKLFMFVLARLVLREGLVLMGGGEPIMSKHWHGGGSGRGGGGVGFVVSVKKLLLPLDWIRSDQIR